MLHAPEARSTVLAPTPVSYRYPVPFAVMAKRDRPRRVLVVATSAILAMALAVGAASHPVGTAAARDSVTILGASAASLDPAIQSDAGSAQVVSQLFESLTDVDASARVQPALAQSWETQNGGKRIVFHLRPGLSFSDGSPLKASDVVHSWLRVLSPTSPSQLASLLDEVVGARAYREGTGPQSGVGITATSDTDVQVDMATPTLDFPAIVSSPTLAVVPANIDVNPSVLLPGTFVGSGGYVLSALTATETTLTANPHYWAGPPPITTVHLLSTPSSAGAVADFQAGSLDYTPIDGGDATWVAYDKTLGPSLRVEPSPSVEYYGFDTTKPPFSNVHVRRAFELGIDWNRIVTLRANPLEVPATGMVPEGVPGHSATNFGPKFDLATAKSELAAAGYADGVGFPSVTLVTTGAGLDGAIVAQLKANLGIDIGYRSVSWDVYNQMLLHDPPAFWEMDWVADYPGADDFLGLLLGSGQTNNFGKWSNADFDAAVAKALASSDATTAQQDFDQAQSIVQDQAPVVPVDYGAGYALAANGLLGALPNSQGLMRYAGLAWATGS
jgi:ABC-type transport system substrate-binding protein